MSETLSRTIVLIENPRAIAEYRYGFLLNEYYLIPQVSEWMVENIKGYWTWEEQYRDHTDMLNLIFRFNDPNDALLFKLTWGGA